MFRESGDELFSIEARLGTFFEVTAVGQSFLFEAKVRVSRVAFHELPTAKARQLNLPDVFHLVFPNEIHLVVRHSRGDDDHGITVFVTGRETSVEDDDADDGYTVRCTGSQSEKDGEECGGHKPPLCIASHVLLPEEVVVESDCEEQHANAEHYVLQESHPTLLSG